MSVMYIAEPTNVDGRALLCSGDVGEGKDLASAPCTNFPGWDHGGHVDERGRRDGDACKDYR